MRGLILVLALGLALAGCGGGEETSAETTTVTNPTTTTSVTTRGRFHYPEVVVENYMKSCTRGDRRKQAFCGCTLDKLSTDVSVRDFARVGASSGNLPPRLQRLITQAAVACRDKL